MSKFDVLIKSVEVQTCKSCLEKRVGRRIFG